jgi:hypothetical protein
MRAGLGGYNGEGRLLWDKRIGVFPRLNFSDLLLSHLNFKWAAGLKISDES